jgi:hypothetical protein
VVRAVAVQEVVSIMKEHEGHRVEEELTDNLPRHIESFAVCIDCGEIRLKLRPPIDDVRLVVKFCDKLTNFRVSNDVKVVEKKCD